MAKKVVLVSVGFELLQSDVLKRCTPVLQAGEILSKKMSKTVLCVITWLAMLAYDLNAAPGIILLCSFN